MRHCACGTLIWALFLVLGCGESFPSVTTVDRLRILGVQAEPPEVGGELGRESAISALIADPLQLEDPARELTVIYLACTPHPDRAANSSCTAMSKFSNPDKLSPDDKFDDGAGGCGAESSGVGGQARQTEVMHFIGAERCFHGEGCEPLYLGTGSQRVELPRPVYNVPDDLDLEGLEAGHPARILGVNAVVVALALPLSVEELLGAWEEDHSCGAGDDLLASIIARLEDDDRAMTVKRIRVRGPDETDEPNRNPIIEGLAAGGRLLAPVGDEEPPVFRSGTNARFEARLPAMDEKGKPLSTDSLYQSYTLRGAEGQAIRQEREEWVVSWFTTAGKFDRQRTRGVERTNEWIGPVGDAESPIPVSGRAFFYAVVRDGRGGTNWVVREGLVRP